MTTPVPEPHMQPRSLWWIVILAVPILSVPAVMFGYVWMWWTGLEGRPAEGERVDITLRGCVEAWPTVERRVEKMGLQLTAFQRSGETLRVTTTLPVEPRVAGRIPATLAKRGVLSILDDGHALFDNGAVADASVRLNLRMIPTTLLDLTPDAAHRLDDWVDVNKKGEFLFVVDGVAVGEQRKADGIENGELEIAPYEEHDERRRMEWAAELSIVVAAPHACDVTVVSVTPVEEAPAPNP